jgi:hypothetical protein
MNPQTHKLFAQLCESLVLEVSTTGNLVNSLPGGTALIKKLHTMGLAHNQEYEPQAKIEWSRLKDWSMGGWVVLQYPKGVGAIHQRDGNYIAVASPANQSVDPETGVVAGLETFENSRGGNILEFLKQRLGGHPRKLYIGRDSGEVARTQRKRAELKQGSKSGRQVSSDTLVIKFKPLWVRATTAAIADIKGMVTSMVKNDAFEKAKKKIDWLNQLVAALDEFESNPDSVPRPFHEAARKAVLMSAVHYYPDETGELSRSYGGYQLENEAGMRHLLQDIASGDTSKIGTVLAFFKRNLLSK